MKKVKRETETALGVQKSSTANLKQRLCLSVTEAAEQLGVCRNHLYSYIDNGDLASFKLGQRRLINREALDDFRMTLQQKHVAEMRGES